MKELEFTPEETRKAKELLSAFEGRLQYPPNQVAMRFAIRGFLMIAHMEPRQWISSRDPMTDEIITSTEKDPAGWLAEQAYQSSTDRFPTMYEFRRLYEQRFTPRDGRHCSDFAA